MLVHSLSWKVGAGTSQLLMRSLVGCLCLVGAALHQFSITPAQSAQDSSNSADTWTEQLTESQGASRELQLASVPSLFEAVSQEFPSINNRVPISHEPWIGPCTGQKTPLRSFLMASCVQSVTWTLDLRSGPFVSYVHMRKRFDQN